MDEEVARVVAAIHASPLMAALALSGAGTQGLAWLLAVPGGSATVLDASVPYSRAAFDRYLGFAPEQYASPAAALALAARAATVAGSLHPAGTLTVGLGCAAALAATPPRRGSHRAAVAVWHEHGATLYQLLLQKDRHDRAAEEALASRLVLRALAEVAGLDGSDLCGGDADEPLSVTQIPLLQEAQALLAGESPLLLLERDGTLSRDGSGQALILSGSFNPLHEGHRRLAAAAAALVGAPACFEIAARNADKPTLDPHELLLRLRQFAGYAPVAASAAPLFTAKARLFPGAAFVVGADTAARLLAPRYYGGEAQMHEALNAIRAQGCRFLVAGRLAGKQFETLATLDIPAAARDLFAPIPDFREDISSTQIRGD